MVVEGSLVVLRDGTIGFVNECVFVVFGMMVCCFVGDHFYELVFEGIVLNGWFLFVDDCFVVFVLVIG